MQNPEFLSGDRFASGKKEKRKLSASPEVSKNTTQAEAPAPEEKKNTGFSAFEKRAAKVIRILSVPPLMAGVLVLILSFCRKDIFPGAREIVAALLTLTVFPILAYPVARLIPALRRRGREGERNTAFLLCFCGYLAAFVWGTVTGCNRYLLLIFLTYLLSVVWLLFFNKILHIRASGHSCSITGPIVLVCIAVHPAFITAGVLVYGLIFRASVVTKRHTVSEFLFGSLTFFLAFGFAALFLLV